MSQRFAMAVPYVSHSAPARPEAVGDLRRAVRAFAAEHGATGKALAAIELAVSEAAANAVQHAYAEEQGEVQVIADVEDGELEVVITDDGRGFRRELAADGEGLGLGLALMHRGSTAFEIRDRPDGGVEVWLRFPLAG